MEGPPNARTSTGTEPATAPAIVVEPGTIVPGRARPAAPLRREGPAKLTGTALYTDDIVVPGAWYGATIRSTDAHATFDALELDQAFDWSKVVVVTAADIPGENIVSSIKSDQPILVPVGGEIQHHAEPLALIAAPDKATLREARHRARPRTTKLPGVFDPLESDHVFAQYTIEAGTDVEAALAAADVVLEGEYRVGHQEQLYIENNAMIAVPTDGGGVTVTGSLQCPYYLHAALKRGLGLDDRAARVVQAETGGGFGGKEEFPSVIGLHAALLARKAQKPVRMIYERHEDIAATTKRHPAIVRHRTGVTRDGRLVAQDIEVVMDGGAYCTLTPVVLSRGALHSGGPYRCPERPDPRPGDPHEHPAQRRVPRVRRAADRVRGRDPPQPDRRAAGHLAARDPATERLPARRHHPDRPDPARQRRRRGGPGACRGGRGVHEAPGEGPMTRGGGARARDRRPVRRCARAGSARPPGSGLALAWHGAGFTGSGEIKLASVASLELTADGRVRILTASTEMGQGTKTIFPQLVGEALGIRDDDVELAPQDTAYVPDSGPTVASRTAMVVGGLLIKAARRLREQVETATGGSFAQTAAAYARDHGATRIDQKFEPYPDSVTFDDDLYRGDAYPAFGWAACVAHVEVDLDTGEVYVRDVVAVDDIGRVIHPVLAEGQVEGGTLQAVGYATIEEIKLRDGRYLNDRLATYIIPTSLDAPRISTILVEAPFHAAPHGAKGVGELPMDVGAPAVVAAIADATGVWITELPASPERVLAGLAAQPAVAGLPPGASAPALEASA